RAMGDEMAALTAIGLTPDQFQTVFALQAEAEERARAALPLEPLAVADREDEIMDWLQDQGLDDGWKLAPTLVAAGLDLDWLEQTAQMLEPDTLAPVLRWISSGLTATGLLDQLG